MAGRLLNGVACLTRKNATLRPAKCFLSHLPEGSAFLAEALPDVHGAGDSVKVDVAPRLLQLSVKGHTVGVQWVLSADLWEASR